MYQTNSWCTGRFLNNICDPFSTLLVLVCFFFKVSPFSLNKCLSPCPHWSFIVVWEKRKALEDQKSYWIPEKWKGERIGGEALRRSCHGAKQNLQNLITGWAELEFFMRCSTQGRAAWAILGPMGHWSCTTWFFIRSTECVLGRNRE